MANVYSRWGGQKKAEQLRHLVLALEGTLLPPPFAVPQEYFDVLLKLLQAVGIFDGLDCAALDYVKDVRRPAHCRAVGPDRSKLWWTRRVEHGADEVRRQVNFDAAAVLFGALALGDFPPMKPNQELVEAGGKGAIRVSSRPSSSLSNSKGGLQLQQLTHRAAGILSPSSG